MEIRKATIEDLDALYELGKNSPELRVSSTEDFMDIDEFKNFITDKNCVFLVAEEKKSIAGFIIGHTEWVNMIVKNLKNKYGYLVFLVVAPEFRRKGAATKLYKECITRLKARGATHVYGWANAEGDNSAIQFLRKQGFAKGHKYVWMDKKL
jgi:ribosomal protein S18 acetylase RimI-like enzyme